MEYEQRIKNALIQLGLIKKGAVFSSHYSLTGFGHESKPYHFNISFDDFSEKYSFFRVNHCTSSKSSGKKKYKYFKFNILRDSSVLMNEDDDNSRTTYCLFEYVSRIQYKDFESKNIAYRGVLNPETLNRYQRARRNFLAITFGRKR